MTKLTKSQYVDLMNWVNKVYSHNYDDPEYKYHETLPGFKCDFICNLSTFLFDHSDSRAALKRRLPVDVYIRVLEALADGDHET